MHLVTSSVGCKVPALMDSRIGEAHVGGLRLRGRGLNRYDNDKCLFSKIQLQYLNIT